MLLIVYSAVKCINTMGHRELMDMISAVKGMNIVSGIDQVSKSKTRGIFELLKFSKSLIFSHVEGEPVQLSLGVGIDSFKDFKERHDMYLKNCWLRLHIRLAPNIRKQLVWDLDNETMMKRLLEFQLLEEKVMSFFFFGTVSLIPFPDQGMSSTTTVEDTFPTLKECREELRSAVQQVQKAYSYVVGLEPGNANVLSELNQMKSKFANLIRTGEGLIFELENSELELESLKIKIGRLSV
jgi:hypothetical protein